MPEIHNNALPNDISWEKITKTNSSLSDLAIRTTADLTDFPNPAGNAEKILTTDGIGLSWASVSGAFGLFYKADPTTVVFNRTGNDTAEIKAGTVIDVEGTAVKFTSATTITMPTLTAGTDYAIWVKTDGTIQASTNFTAPPSAGTWRKIGGFHYAPGGNAVPGQQAGGDTTPQINRYSFWDLKFRPACPDPRGMTLVAERLWFDIYLSNQYFSYADYNLSTQTNTLTLAYPSSQYGLYIASGNALPYDPYAVPRMYMSFQLGAYTWFDAQEVSALIGKRCPTQAEFMLAAFGTSETISSGGGVDADVAGQTLSGATNAWNKFTSLWGVIQATGTRWIWSRDRGGPYAGASWAGVTDNVINPKTTTRGSEYQAPYACVLGGSRNSGSYSGSRASYWGWSALTSNVEIGSRFCCDHLIVD